MQAGLMVSEYPLVGSKAAWASQCLAGMPGPVQWVRSPTTPPGVSRSAEKRMRSSTLPSPLASTCHDTKVLGLAQLGSVAGSPICAVLKVSTRPWAPESTVADTMSVAAEVSLALVSRLITSPVGSLIDAGPAATAGPGATNHAVVTRPAIVRANPAVRSNRNLRIAGTPSWLEPSRSRNACQSTPPQATEGLVRHRPGFSSPHVPSDPYVQGTSGDDGAMRTGWSAADIPDLTGRVAFVTGANRSLGREITRYLSRQSAR